MQTHRLQDVIEARGEADSEFSRCRAILDRAYHSAGTLSCEDGAAEHHDALDTVSMNIDSHGDDEHWWAQEELRRARDIAMWEDEERQRRSRQLEAWEEEQRQRWEAEEAEYRARLSREWDDEARRLRDVAEIRWQAEERARLVARAEQEAARQARQEELDAHRNEERAAWAELERSRRQLETQRWVTHMLERREAAEREERADRARAEREELRASWERQEQLRRAAEHERWVAHEYDRRAAELRVKGANSSVSRRLPSSHTPLSSPSILTGTVQATINSPALTDVDSTMERPHAACGTCSGSRIDRLALQGAPQRQDKLTHTGAMAVPAVGPTTQPSRRSAETASAQALPNSPPACNLSYQTTSQGEELSTLATAAAAAAIELAGVQGGAPAGIDSIDLIDVSSSRCDLTTVPAELNPAPCPSNHAVGSSAPEATIYPPMLHHMNSCHPCNDSAVLPGACVVNAEHPSRQGIMSLTKPSDGEDIVAATDRVIKQHTAAASAAEKARQIAHERACSARCAHERAVMAGARLRSLEDEGKLTVHAGPHRAAHAHAHAISHTPETTPSTIGSSIVSPRALERGLSFSRTEDVRCPPATFVERREPTHIEVALEADVGVSYEEAMRDARRKLKAPRGRSSLIEEERQQEARREEALRKEREELAMELRLRSPSQAAGTEDDPVGIGVHRPNSSHLTPIEVEQMEADRRQFAAHRAAERQTKVGEEPPSGDSTARSRSSQRMVAAKLEALRAGKLQKTATCQLCEQKLYPVDTYVVDGYKVCTRCIPNRR